jgi:hypothetical protein
MTDILNNVNKPFLFRIEVKNDESLNWNSMNNTNTQKTVHKYEKRNVLLPRGKVLAPSTLAPQHLLGTSAPARHLSTCPALESVFRCWVPALTPLVTTHNSAFFCCFKMYFLRNNLPGKSIETGIVWKPILQYWTMKKQQFSTNKQYKCKLITVCMLEPVGSGPGSEDFEFTGYGSINFY